ncbi:Hypothetical protein LUCI_4965 [Lucifera butyrica]|uniref:Uncharacterized protein n=1 Tax=Lucifera butyrica TaxID=1351585 RepID=A0A498RFD8_9FIRM|nr:hypothetical protein [Lucifera butyrica]VBB09667.1 Hypothetical protein LUCI_4965 [Lucifera butyrica]
MGHKHEKNENPTKKLKEWQDNQYNPGYYIGGNIPPYVAIPSKTSLLGKLYKIGARIVGVIYILIGVALICIASIGVILVWESSNEVGNRTGVFVAGAISCSLGILSILLGLKYIRNIKSKAKSKN